MPDDKSADVQRKDERDTINKEFESYDAFIHEYVTNISRSGVFVRSKTPLAIGTKVNLRFTVIMDDIETIEGIGEVVRNQEEPLGMGVVFVSLTSHSQDLIAKLITRRRIGERPRRGTTMPPAPGAPKKS